MGVAEVAVVAVEPALASVPVAVAVEVVAVAEVAVAVAAPASVNTLGHRKAKRQSHIPIAAPAPTGICVFGLLLYATKPPANPPGIPQAAAAISAFSCFGPPC